MNIEQQINDRGGVFRATKEGIKAGTMTYRLDDRGIVVIDHTEVNPLFTGHNIGHAMVLACVDYVRGEGLRIKPDCPFARSIFEQNHDIKDVLHIN